MPWIETCGVIAARSLSADERARGRELAADLGRLCGGTPVVHEDERRLLAVASAGARDDAAACLVRRGGEVALAAGDVRAAGARDGHEPSLPARLHALAPAPGGAALLRLTGDRHGLVPLHHVALPSGLAFATRPGPLVRAGLAAARVDADAVIELLVLEHVTGDRTLVPGLSVLPPGATLVLDAAGALRVEAAAREMLPTRRRGEATAGGSPSVRDVAGRLDRALRAAVVRAAEGGSAVTLPLSGGLDSRALLGAARAEGLDVRALTFGSPSCADVLVAGELARRLGVAHEVVPIDGSFLPRHLEHVVETTGGMVAAHHAHILVLAPRLPGAPVLDGMGGDALSGGHLAWGLLAARDPARAAARLWRRRATGFASAHERQALLEPEFLARAGADPQDVVRRHLRPGEAGWRGCHRFDLLERQRRFIHSGPLLLRRFTDVRTPFYDRDVFDLLAGLPARHLVEQRAYLALFARHQPALAAVPDAARHLRLSRPLALRAGQHALAALGRRLPGVLRRPPPSSPTDYPGWFAGPLAGWLRERLLDGGGVLDGIVRREAVQRLLDAPARGEPPRVERLGALLALQAWLALTGARA